MKLRFEKDTVIFRLSEDELNHLVTKDTLQEGYSFGEQDMIFSVDSTQAVVRPSLSLMQQGSVTKLTFFPASEQLETLLAIGKSRDGVCWFSNGMNVVIQVDMKQDSRAKMKVLV